MKNLNQENLLIFFWLCILVSINSIYSQTFQAQYLKFFFPFSKKSFFYIFNYIRFYLPILFLPILIIFFFKSQVKKPNIIIPLFFAYYCWQLIMFFVSGANTGEIPLKRFDTYSYTAYKEAFWNNLHLISCAISALIVISIAQNLNLKEFNKKILLTTLLFLGIVSIYFSYNLLSESIERNLKFVYNSLMLNSDDWQTFGQASPRITGVSRMVLIFYFLAFCYFINTNKKILLYFITIALGLLLYKMQARGSFVGIFMLFFLFFIFNSFSFKKKLKIFIILLVIPVFLFEAYYHMKSNNFYVFTQKNNGTVVVQNKNRLLDLKETASSGRTNIWRNALLVVKEKKIIFGYGPQADRFLMTELLLRTKKESIFFDRWGNKFVYEDNASNALVYSYLCGGIPGLLMLIIIYLLAIITVIKNIFIEKIFLNKNTLKTFSTILLIYLGIRSVFENSFSVFSVDYILFILSYLIARKGEESERQV
jgi:hypothetical protein